MADFWGGSWGSSWGLSWTGDGTPPTPPADELDTHDGQPRVWDVRKAESTQQERERLRKASQDELRSIVERAFRKANGEPDEPTEPLTQPERREMARYIQADIRTDGLVSRLRDLEALIVEYERLVQEERDDEEAAAILLLMN